MRKLTAAIQFGSSRIFAAAAWVDGDGQHEVAAIESVQTAGCIRHGCVVSVDDTAARIKSLMQKLSNRVKTEQVNNLNAAYVGLCGMSMRSMEYQPSTLLGEGGVPNAEVIRHLSDKSLKLNIAGYDILGLHSNGESIDGQNITGHHQLIIAEHRLKQGISAAMERANIRVVGWMATPLVEADILTPEEKEKGVMLVDLGYQVTSMSIWKDKQLKHLIVIPLGCNAVTLDIATKGLRLEETEELKTIWSDASRPNDDNPQAMPEIHTAIPLKELNLIVASRYEEILANIAVQIEQSGYKGQLEAGCVLTGGGSVQKGLTTLFSKRLEVNRINTRSCNALRYSSSERKPYLTSLMTMLRLCEVSCEETIAPAVRNTPTVVTSNTPAPQHKPEPEAPKTVQPSNKKHTAFRNFIGDLFSGLNEN